MIGVHPTAPGTFQLLNSSRAARVFTHSTSQPCWSAVGQADYLNTLPLVDHYMWLLSPNNTLQLHSTTCTIVKMTSEYNWLDWPEDEDEWGDITDSELLQAVHEAEREERLKEARRRKEEC